eukprot:3231445-Rhodomonas_salina.2
MTQDRVLMYTPNSNTRNSNLGLFCTRNLGSVFDFGKLPENSCEHMLERSAKPIPRAAWHTGMFRNKPPTRV